MFQPSYTTSFPVETRAVISVRKIGTETWIDTALTAIAYTSGQGVANSHEMSQRFGVQEIAFGLFPDSGGTKERSVQMRTFKVCQGSDMSQYYMLKDDGTNVLPPAKNIIRGRYVAPLPAYIENNESIVWGGIGGMENDRFFSSINNSYTASNTIKIPSPRFEYRTIGEIP